VYAALLILNNKLNRILTLLGDEVMPELEALGEQIGRLESVADQAVAKIQQLIEQGGGNIDPAQVQALVDRVKAVGDKLEAAAAA
jgi:hypothetical protein